MALILCDGCGRHVRETENRCPFCGERRAASAVDIPLVEVSSPLSRAALVLAGAMALGGCERGGVGRDQSIVQPYGAPPNPTPPDSGVEPAIAQPYGVPVMDRAEMGPDSGVAPQDSGVALDAGRRARTRTNAIAPNIGVARPAYGIAPPSHTAAYGGPGLDPGFKGEDEEKP